MIQDVFVYGSLMPGCNNYPVALEAGAHSAQPACLEGYELWHLEPEGYPALRPGRGRVRGVLLRYLEVAAALPLLDRLEGVDTDPSEYRCVIETARLADGTPVRCWTYVYARKDRLGRAGARRLEGERWEGGRRGAVN
ncbi:gamma-glutamylcyclotransferase (GGCT)/AIG2-like uncharacterized protein YtfP [Deinobacterium chartae]|uniref:Gamma-glutamylcyclotransferase (GGCT)/AIG2-like uncharacterized protein YtfP n=1 Tax=Deinobacterium chartae TaxID=521158 RepID=A0A841I3M3_9DEIO|nr:gamma-glutamylcyclotransferase family protein [Deinobacterium chartae]MBB6098515.1 gamma-glutamylcyclotransferase (GGCT)/AIG2-like uncharacterized protein YtfP [Deinobacterium chartae]